MARWWRQAARAGRKGPSGLYFCGIPGDRGNRATIRTQAGPAAVQIAELTLRRGRSEAGSQASGTSEAQGTVDFGWGPAARWNSIRRSNALERI